MSSLLKKLGFVFATMLSMNVAFAQTDTIPATSFDPKLLEFINSTRPQEFTIRNLSVRGTVYFDSSLVLSLSGLHKGQVFTYPGTDIFAKAINNLWKQRLFADVEVNLVAVQGDDVDVEVYVAERPKLGSFKFQGAKKSELDDLKTKTDIKINTIITESTRKTIKDAVEKYYIEKGFYDAKVSLIESKDPVFPNANAMIIAIDRGLKVKIDEINFFGNETISSRKLKKQMKGTKEMTKASLYRNHYQSTYGPKETYSFKEYLGDFGFLSGTNTLDVLDPYFRLKFSASKFNNKKYIEDKEKVVRYFNTKGYRDAEIIRDTQVVQNSKMYIDLQVKEGKKYYFGKTVWKGNSVYNDTILNNILKIQEGDVYDAGILYKRLGLEPSQDGADITSAYQDQGYLFFNLIPVETAIRGGDTIDHEIRIVEGPQARIKNVVIMGNDKTKDHVIRRELTSAPGDLFSRSELMRSVRQLASLNYFEQESIAPQPKPNQADGTVDIFWNLKEKSSDQLELSAGWGGGIGFTGTLGVTFNNFSIKNIWKKNSWDPLPVGDGQKLSLRYQSNGRFFRSINASFTEPWLGGKKRNSLTFGFNNTKYAEYNTKIDANGMYTYDREYARNHYILINGASVGIGKQLRWPDDWFSIMYTLNYTKYKLVNYNIGAGTGGFPFTNGSSDNVSLKIALARNSVSDPIFPRNGANIGLSVQFTPPYSLFGKSNYTQEDAYKRPEYHKWRFNSEWYVPLGRARGEDKNRQFVLKLAAKYGIMGRYNSKFDYSPFERFQLGDAGMQNSFALMGFDIVAHRGYPVYYSSDPKVNPENSGSGQPGTNLFTIFNKYQAELRYPVVTNPSSTIFGLVFFEAANGWKDFKNYNPFELRRSVGVGARFHLPMFGLLGFDYGIGLDRLQGGNGFKGAGKFTFMLGFEPE